MTGTGTGGVADLIHFTAGRLLTTRLAYLGSMKWNRAVPGRLKSFRLTLPIELVATKTPMLFLRLCAAPVQRNHPAVLSHRFDSRPTTLIWGSPFRGNIFGVSNLRELFLVSLQPLKFFHSLLYQICMD